MDRFNPEILKQLYIPPPDSHKGQNGKVMVIGGSHLFHSASFWALETASKIADMVYYSSIPMNNEIVKKLKTKFANGIVISREKLHDYIAEADSVLIGPGLPRPDGQELGDDDTKILTEKLFSLFPSKKWVVDGGSLQVIEPEILPKTAIITPNVKEFEMLKVKIQNAKVKSEIQKLKIEEQVSIFAREFSCTVLLKGEVDYVCNHAQSIEVTGGNAGMTKGGTGDVLAGLVAALYAKNDAFLSACSASFINKKAGESLFERVGLYFNASDLVNELPGVMKKYILD